MNEQFIPIAMFAMLAYVVKVISDNNLRRTIAKNNQITEEVKYLLGTPRKDYVPASLKWGLVLLAVGIGASLGQLVQEELREQFTIAFMLIGGGLALVIYYFTARKQQKKEESEAEE